MITTKYRDLTIEDHTPTRCKRKQLKIYAPRRLFFGFVTWNRHRWEYFCSTNQTEWNSAAFIQVGEVLAKLNQEAKP